MTAGRALLAASIVALSGCQSAIAESSNASAPEDTERLLAQPPDGWSAIFASKRPGVRIAEYIPPGESAEEWVQVLDGLAAGDSVVTTGSFMLKSELRKGELGEGDEH